MAANRAYRAGMARIVVEAAKGDPAAAADSCWATPEERRQRGRAGRSWPTAACPGPYNSSVLRATERLVAELQARRHRGPALHRGQEGPVVLPLPRPGGGASRSSASASAPTSPTPGSVAAAVATPFLPARSTRSCWSPPATARPGSQPVEVRQLLPLPDPMPPPTTPRTRARPPSRATAAGATPSSSPTSRRCWPSWPPRPSSPRSSPPCWRARPPSSPPSSGRWPRPATTPTS